MFVDKKPGYKSARDHWSRPLIGGGSSFLYRAMTRDTSTWNTQVAPSTPQEHSRVVSACFSPSQPHRLAVVSGTKAPFSCLFLRGGEVEVDFDAISLGPIECFEYLETQPAPEMGVTDLE